MTNTNPLAALRTAIWQHVTITDHVVAALRAAGEETDALKMLVYGTYMARRMNPGAKECTPAMVKKAELVLSYLGASSKGEGKKRTVEQERFYTGARQYMFALRKKADVGASDTRGGANNTGKRTPRTPTASDDADIPMAPIGGHKAKYETENDIRAQVLHTAHSLMLFLEAHRSISGDKTRAPVARFLKDVSVWAPKPDTK